MKTINLHEVHPILDMQGHIVFVNNGNLALCYSVLNPEIYSLSEKDFEDIHGFWFQAFKSLPEQTIVHKQDIFKKTNYTANNLAKNSFLQRATHKHFNGREYMDHSSYLFFILPISKVFTSTKHVNPFRKIENGSHKMLDHNAKEFVNAVYDCVAYINNSSKTRLTPLDEKQILALTQDFFNGFNHDFDTDIQLNKNCLDIGDSRFDLMAINSELCFGDTLQSSRPNDRFTSDDFEFHQGILDGLGLGLAENHIVNNIIRIDDNHKWRKILEKNQEELKKCSNFGTQNKHVLKKVEHILAKINDDENSKIVRGHLNIIFWGQDLKSIATKIKAEFKELDIVPYYPKSEGRKHLFLNSYFGFTSNLSDGDMYVADLRHALCLYLNNGNYMSDNFGIVFNDRLDNIPILKDVWDEDKRRIKARNFAIFAPTGEGKSFLANNILRQYYENGTRLVIIDLGGSYDKFAKLYPHDHVVLRYEQGKSLGINPFYISNRKDLSPEHLEDLTAFLWELLASGSDSTKAQQVAIKKVLLHYYGEIKTAHSLSSLYRFVDKHKATLIKDLGIHEVHFKVYEFLHILSEYVENGIYSFLFNEQEDQTFKLEDKRLIVFELDEVKDNKEILSVMLKLIKSAIQRTIWKNKAERGIILFDEFAKQLKFKNVLESVEFYYQAIRKHNGAIGIILQSINQLPNNATSASILENTQVVYSLRNDKGYDELKSRLNLTAHDLNQLKSIRNQLNGKRKFTEMFIKIGKDSNVFRLEVPPEVHAAYLTDGPENETIMKLYNEHQNMEKAIELFVKGQSQSKPQP